jgi:hypothetical protein
VSDPVNTCVHVGWLHTVTGEYRSLANMTKCPDLGWTGAYIWQLEEHDDLDDGFVGRPAPVEVQQMVDAVRAQQDELLSGAGGLVRSQDAGSSPSISAAEPDAFEHGLVTKWRDLGSNEMVDPVAAAIYRDCADELAVYHRTRKP